MSDRRPDSPLHIIVVGGGSAGYLAALCFERLAAPVEVTVLDPDAIPVIGVGESTTSEMPPLLHRVLGLDADRFYREVLPTWKLGIKFIWGAPGDSYFNYPFDRGSLLEPHLYDGHIRNATLSTILMSHDLTPVLQVSPEVYLPLLDSVPYGYHIDSVRFLRHLRTVAVERGVRVTQQVVTEVLRNGSRGIAGLRLDDGQIAEGDLYIDCSGFRTRILGDALGTPFMSFGSTLFCDSAWIGSAPHEGLLKPYTTAETMESGWLWNIPQRDCDHIGYVFSSQHASDDDARGELARHVPSASIDRVLRFRSGRLTRWIEGNVLAIGNSYGFVEPLESTALFVIGRQCLLAAHNARALCARDDALVHRLNETIGSIWDYLRWFLSLHYRFNRRAESGFWRDCRASVDISGAEPILAKYQEAAPRFGMTDEAGGLRTNFDVFGHDVLLLGQGVPVALRKTDVDKTTYRERLRELDRLAEISMTGREALAIVESSSTLSAHLAVESGWIRRFEDELRLVR